MTVGILLLTYGSARDAADVPAYLSRVRQGRVPPDDLVADFQRRYALIGGSPLIPITRRLAGVLEQQLGSGFVVEAGMRFSEPTVARAAGLVRDRGATRLIGLILAPQYSPIIMGQYNQQLEQAAGEVDLPWQMIGDWHLHPAFIAVLAERLRAGLAAFPEDAPVLMTAHSLPKRVVDREPEYIDKLRATAQAVATAAGLARERWHFAYQSAGHTPEEWLKPDMLEVLPELARAGHRHVLLAPVQFVADHLETLYDIDIAGREQAEQGGIAHFRRVPAPNDSPEFAAALAQVVRAAL